MLPRMIQMETCESSCLEMSKVTCRGVVWSVAWFAVLAGHSAPCWELHFHSELLDQVVAVPGDLEPRLPQGRPRVCL